MAMEKSVLTVANVNAYIKQIMDRDYVLKHLWVQGEVSNYKAHGSGHLYFTLKDSTSSISCIMFKSYVKGLSQPIKNGLKIIVGGAVSVYEPSGQYQLYVHQIKEEGLGQRHIAFEKLKKKLKNEGWFDEGCKLPIPRYAKTIGIVTSETGAAIRDIVQVAKRRNPYVKLRLYPSLVQGPKAKENIIKAIEFFNKEKNHVHVLIIGRGGGSIEDLWAFNEEDVARAIINSQIPIISAVGHETDFTISDFVADYRAPTPSAAAELAVYDHYEMVYRLKQHRSRLTQWLYLQLSEKKQYLSDLTMKLKHRNPKEVYEKKYQYIADLEDRLTYYFKLGLNNRKHELALYKSRLEGLSPMARLKHGYAYLSDKDNHKIDTITQFNKGDAFKVTLSDGQVVATVEQVMKEGMYE